MRSARTLVGKVPLYVQNPAQIHAASNSDSHVLLNGPHRTSPLTFDDPADLSFDLATIHHFAAADRFDGCRPIRNERVAVRRSRL